MSRTASIVLVAGNDLDRVRACLESVRKNINGLDCQIIVIDNSVQEPVRRLLVQDAHEHPGGILIHNRIRERKARCFNIGSAACQGEFLVFLDSAILVSRDSLSTLLRYAGDPEIGMVGPVTNWADNESRIQVDYTDISSLDEFAEAHRRMHTGQLFEIDTLSFDCLVMRRQVFEQVGKLDEGYVLEMFAESDYAQRVRRQAARVVCAQDVFVHHWEPKQESGKTWPWTVWQSQDMKARMEKEQNQGLDYPWTLFQQDRRRFEEKWGEKWAPPGQQGRLRAEQFDQLIEGYIRLDLEAHQQRKSIEELERRVQALETERDDIYSGTGWKMLQGVLAVRTALGPPGTSRQRFLTAVENILDGTLKAGKAGLHGLGERQASRASQRRSSMVEQDLARILEAHTSAKQVMIFLPTVPWDVPLFQRPHQLALALARLGCLVFFAEKPESPATSGGFRRVADSLYVSTVPVDIFKNIPSPAAFALAYNHNDIRALNRPRVIYEYIDELEVFPYDQVWLRRSHDELLRSADLAIATADRLFREIQGLRNDALLLPNGVDDAHIRQSIQAVSQPPEELAEIVRQGRPVIGYYGALAHWLDGDLLVGAAADRPTYQFLLIGPDFDGSFEESRIGEQLDNLLWLGAKPYALLPGYLRYFDVGIIPFKVNPITNSTSPLKLFEYMSAGKPCVTTAMHECMKYPEVLIAHDRDEFTHQLDEALRLKSDPAYLARIQQIARANTWDHRAAAIIEALRLQTRPKEHAMREAVDSS